MVQDIELAIVSQGSTRAISQPLGPWPSAPMSLVGHVLPKFDVRDYVSSYQ
jgi:hypothetical protein